MHYLSILLGIASVQLLAAASPGPTFIIVSRYSIGESRRRGLLVVGGVLVADLIWAILVASGLSVVILRYPAAYTVLQIRRRCLSHLAGQPHSSQPDAQADRPACRRWLDPLPRPGTRCAMDSSPT